MKMIRKISVFALVLVLVCLFSASVFAANTFTGVEVYDEENVISAYAQIQQIGTSAELNIDNAPGLESHDLRITCLYNYKRYGDTTTYSGEGWGEDDGSAGWGRTTFGIWTSQGSPIQQFTKAVYSFNGTFTAWGGTYTYNPALVTIEP